LNAGPYVSVVGSGDAYGELYEKAREVGRLVADVVAISNVRFHR